MATVNLRQQATRAFLGARPSISSEPRILCATGQILSVRGFSSVPARNSMNGVKSRFEAQANRQAMARPMNRGQGGAAERDATALEQLTRTISFGTYVSPPATRFPPSIRFAWAIAKRRVLDYVAVLFFSWGSKPKFLKAPTWKQKKSVIVTQAKALHRTMGEALAAGDKVTLRKVCIPALATKLSGVIDARRRGVRKSWELVQYNQPWRYPRLADRKLRVTAHPELKGLPAIYQAVVSIASRQRLVEYDDSPQGGGKVVPGSEKEVDVVEHVVLISTVNDKTYEQSEWKIWGTINETTAESLRYDEETLAQAQSMPMN